MRELLDIMARLRDPEKGCPWDLAQDFRSIVPHTLEEAYEVADVIERGELKGLRDELSDLLFQVVFYARLAEEAGLFAFDDVVESLAAKLVRRHPHVFGDDSVSTPAEQSRSWESIKAAERRADTSGPVSELDDIPRALPALSRAAKLGRRASRVGFDWDGAAGPLDKIREELGELEAELGGGENAVSHARARDEIGDVLLAVTNLARHLGVDPEAALRGTNRKFERRFRHLEAELHRRGATPSAERHEEMERLWEAVKESEPHEGKSGSGQRD